MHPSKLAAALAALATLALPVHADEGWASRDYQYANRQMNDFVSRFERNLVDPVARGVRARGRSAAAPVPARAQGQEPSRGQVRVATTVPDRAAAVPRLMAAAYPEGERARMEGTFGQLLAGYEKIEHQFGLPRHDVAGAVAAFIAGCYMGYRNVDFPDAHFAPLVAQMRAIIASDPEFAGSPVAARQEMYERMAILGMFMANARMALRQRPDAQAAERVRQAAGGYLQQFLKTDAERVELTAQGLVLR